VERIYTSAGEKKTSASSISMRQVPTKAFSESALPWLLGCNAGKGIVALEDQRLHGIRDKLTTILRSDVAWRAIRRCQQIMHSHHARRLDGSLYGESQPVRRCFALFISILANGR
jgi:hypothetical protein